MAGQERSYPTTWADLERSTTPMWRSHQQVYTYADAYTTPHSIYFLSPSQCVRFDGIAVEPVDPDMQLPPGF